MKRLLLFSVFLALPLAAQNFSPSASGIGLQGTNSQGVSSPTTSFNSNFPSPSTSAITTSPATNSINNFISPNSALNSNTPTTTGPTTLDQIPLPLGPGGVPVLDQTNTAPTPIPEDTSLLATPVEDSIQQAQEDQLNANPFQNDTETAPGNVTPGGAGGSGTNNTTPIDGTIPVDNVP